MYRFVARVCRLFAGVALSASSLFSFTAANREMAQLRGQPLVLPEGFTVTAHAGAMGTPANSLWSLRQAAESGADVVEVDVSFRPDGTPVIIHDDAPSQRQGVPLAKALAVIAAYAGLRVNLDLKAFGNLPAVEALVAEAGMLERVFFTGVSLERTEVVGRDCPHIPYYLNVSVETEDVKELNALADRVRDCGAVGINLQYNGASRALCEVMHGRGLPVSVWTVNGRRDMCAMLALGPDNITTKRPNKLMLLAEGWDAGK